MLISIKFKKIGTLIAWLLLLCCFHVLSYIYEVIIDLMLWCFDVFYLDVKHGLRDLIFFWYFKAIKYLLSQCLNFLLNILPFSKVLKAMKSFISHLKKAEDNLQYCFTQTAEIWKLFICLLQRNILKF